MFQCKDLLALSSLSKAKILSGANGLDKGVRWVYKPESMHFAKWVKGRELMIISTPVINSLDFDLEKLIHQAVKLNMSGAIILMGDQYIDKIPKEVLSYSHKNRFPLFAISGEVPLIDIFEEIGHAIAYYDNKDEGNEDVLSNIIFGNEMNLDGLRLKCEMLDYNLTLPQMIFVVHLDTPSDFETYDRQVIGAKLKQLFTKRGLPVLISQYSNNYIGLIHRDAQYKTYFRNIYEELSTFLQNHYPKLKWIMGLGKGYQQLEKLQHSFREASRCVTLAGKLEKNNVLYDYNELGFYNLLYEIDDSEAVKGFIQNTIGIVLEYDLQNNTELLKTLKIYIENNLSLVKTAEVMHTHRNTISYRIGRVEEIMGKDIKNAMTRLEIMNAILCYELCDVL